MYVSIHICMHDLYEHMYVCIYINIYTYTYIYIHIYIYICHAERGHPGEGHREMELPIMSRANLVRADLCRS